MVVINLDGPRSSLPSPSSPSGVSRSQTDDRLSSSSFEAQLERAGRTDAPLPARAEAAASSEHEEQNERDDERDAPARPAHSSQQQGSPQAEGPEHTEVAPHEAGPPSPQVESGADGKQAEPAHKAFDLAALELAAPPTSDRPLPPAATQPAAAAPTAAARSAVPSADETTPPPAALGDAALPPSPPAAATAVIDPSPHVAGVQVASHRSPVPGRAETPRPSALPETSQLPAAPDEQPDPAAAAAAAETAVDGARSRRAAPKAAQSRADAQATAASDAADAASAEPAGPAALPSPAVGPEEAPLAHRVAAGAEIADGASQTPGPARPAASAADVAGKGPADTSTSHPDPLSDQPGDGPTTADRARFVQRVARAFAAVGQQGGQVRLRLSPPELGSLRIEIRIRDGALSARLETETAAARALLLDSLPALRERLAQQQIRVEQFEVDISGTGNSPWSHTSEQGGAFAQPSPHARDGRRRAEASGQVERSELPAAPSAFDGGRLNIVV